MKLLLERINQYDDFARTAKEVGNHLGKNAMMWWRIWDEDIVEWSERKGDHIFDMDECYQKEAAKASKEIHMIINSLDTMMYS